jgi:hypothetical protein
MAVWRRSRGFLAGELAQVEHSYFHCAHTRGGYGAWLVTDRVVPVTACRAATNDGVSRRPIVPHGPARKIRMPIIVVSSFPDIPQIAAGPFFCETDCALAIGRARLLVLLAGITWKPFAPTFGRDAPHTGSDHPLDLGSMLHQITDHG